MGTNNGPDVNLQPHRSLLRTTGWVLAICAYGILLWLVSPGCASKSITLYSPATGKPIATYTNSTDSEIGGLEAEYDPTTGLFRVKVKSSAQSASDPNEAAWATMQMAIEKIPAVK